MLKILFAFLTKIIVSRCQFQQNISSSFFVESFCPAFMCLQFEFVVFWQKDFGAKAAHKMLVNLPPGPPETPETQVSHLPQDVPAKQLPPQAHPDRARRPEDQPRRQDRL
jgi:hypothetical protein